MSVNSYLVQLADQAIIRDQEKASIQRSISTLRERLKGHFGAQVKDGYVFGSYSRGTILPRHMDEYSDVDYMVVFTDGGLRPQSYLDRLRRFAEMHYGRSEIEQSNPTMVLSLNHIRFELVPALQDWFSGTQIPARASDNQNWLDTDPKGFNDQLIAANQAYGNLVKPLVRVMKYWNAANGYPFESYALEQHVAGYSYGFWGLFSSGRQFGDYFHQIVQSLEFGMFDPQWKKDALSRLKQASSRAQTLERNGDAIQAEAIVKKLLPPVSGLLRAGN